MQEQLPEDEKFWTPGLKALVALNVAFLSLIVIGIIAIALFISPYFYNNVMEFLGIAQ
jgi:hypothetical protein